MDRRRFMGRALGSAALAATPAAGLAREDGEGRPPADIEPAGTGRWRIRSWTWDGGAWRPLIAIASARGGAITIEGPIDPDDRPMVDRWIDRQHA